MSHYDYFNRGRVTGIGTLVNRRFYRLLWSVVACRAFPRARVLELGPGRGEVAALAVGAGCRYLGVDQAPHADTAAAYEVLPARVPPIPAPEGSQDVVVASGVLEHADGAREAWALLQECWRVLAPGGALLLMVPVYDETPDLFWCCDYTHAYPTNPYRMAAVLGDAGFEIRRQMVVRGGVVGYLGKVLWGPVAAAMRVVGALLPDHVRYGRRWYKARMLYAPVQVILAEKVVRE